MADPLKVECPHCNGSLKLKDRSSEGKKVRCPKCQEIFKIELPPEDELEDFDDLAEDFGDDELPDEEPVIKSKSSSKKSGKKKKKSNGPKIPWAIIGIAVAGVLSLGGLVVVVAQFAGGSGSNKIDLTYLLPDANLVARAKVQDVLNSPLLASVLMQPLVQQLLNGTGNDDGPTLKDMVSVTVGSKVDESQSGDLSKRMNPLSPQSGAGAPQRTSQMVTVVRTAVPFQVEKITNANNKAAPQTHNGKTYYKKSGQLAPLRPGLPAPECLYFPEPTVMVLAMEADMKQIIDQNGKQTRRREFDFINPEMTLFMAVGWSTPNDPNATLLADPPSPQLQELERVAHKTLRGFVAGIKLTDHIDLEVIVNCADAAGSAEMKTATDAVFADLKAKYEQQKGMLALLDMNDVAALADKSLASIKVEQMGTRVVAVAMIPSEIKAVGESLAKKLPAMGMRLPGGPPTRFNGPPGSSRGMPGAGFDPSQLPPGMLPPGATPPGATPAAP